MAGLDKDKKKETEFKPGDLVVSNNGYLNQHWFGFVTTVKGNGALVEVLGKSMHGLRVYHFIKSELTKLDI